MKTLTDVLRTLNEKGYTQDFNLAFIAEHDQEHLLSEHPEAFLVDEVFRFDGMTNPDDDVAVYAISSERFGLKGVLVSAYGMYSNPAFHEILSKLTISRPTA